jgi:septum site-determining protein MinC
MDGASNRGRQAFRLKGTMPAITMLSLLTEDIDAIERQLGEHLSQMPQFLLHAPVVLDLEALGETRIDLQRLGQTLRRHRLVPVAVRDPSEAQREWAIEAGFGILQSSPGASRGSGSARGAGEEPSSPGEASRRDAPGSRSARTGREQSSSRAGSVGAEPSAPPVSGTTVRTPVRSGQVIYAIGGDLVVLAPVSSGAELIADGNIHVYAPLRGRALAGAHDNPDASIFCMSLEAEFLCINGYYLMAEEIPPEHRGKPARVHLKDEQLVVTPL